MGDCLTGKAASFDGSDNADIEVDLTTALKALGGLSPSADKLPYFTGANAASLASLSEFMRGVLGKATAAEVRTAIGAINEPGVGVIAGDVSNENAWWVKLSGAVPLIIQGGYDRVRKTVTFPVAFKSIAYSVVATLARGDEEAAQTWNYTATDFYLYQRYGDRWAHWVAIGLG